MQAPVLSSSYKQAHTRSTSKQKQIRRTEETPCSGLVLELTGVCRQLSPRKGTSQDVDITARVPVKNKSKRWTPGPLRCTSCRPKDKTDQRTYACLEEHHIIEQVMPWPLGSSGIGAPCPVPVECPSLHLLVAAEVRGTATFQRQASGKAAVLPKKCKMPD